MKKKKTRKMGKKHYTSEGKEQKKEKKTETEN